MNREEFNKLTKESTDKRFELIERKSKDYATEDVLSNFKRLSLLCSILNIESYKKEGVVFLFIMIKIDRICNLLFSVKEPQNESINDSLDDLQNYIDLLRGLLNEI